MMKKKFLKVLSGVLVGVSLLSVQVSAMTKSKGENLICVKDAKVTGCDPLDWSLQKGRWRCYIKGLKWSAENCWINYKDDWYYINKDGYMITDTRISSSIGNNSTPRMYYVDENGKLVRDQYLILYGVPCYADKDGVITELLITYDELHQK